MIAATTARARFRKVNNGINTELYHLINGIEVLPHA